MQIKVYSRGETTINADGKYQVPWIAEAIRAGADIANAITECTDSERSDISHDEYAAVLADDGTVLWRGWLTGDPDAPAPVVSCPGGCGCRLGTDDADRRECGCDGGCCGD